MKMVDLFEDIKDGVKLLYLLEILTGETLVRLEFFLQFLDTVIAIHVYCPMKQLLLTVRMSRSNLNV